MQVLVVGWIAYVLTESPWLLSIVASARLLPMLLGPLSGAFADRMNRPKLLLVVLVLNIVVTLALATLVLINALAFWHLVLSALLLGIGFSPAMPAIYSLLVDIVGKEDTSNAVSLNMVGISVTRVLGPGLGGVLLASAGAVAALVASAVFLLIAGAAFLLLRHVEEKETLQHHNSSLREMIDGLRLVVTNREMAAILSISLITNASVWPVIQVFMPVFAKDILRIGPAGLGYLMTTMGLGALVSASGIALLGNFRWKGHLYIWGTAVFGLTLGLFALSKSVPVSFAMIGLVGFASSAFGVMQATLILIMAPPQVRGRAMGVQMLAIGILPVATVVQGGIASSIGVPLMSQIAGFLLAFCMFGVFLGLPILRRLA